MSVSLPTWKANVGYEEGEEWVLSKMKTGYPRFFVHLTIQELEREIVSRFGTSDQRSILFPSRAPAERCRLFFQDKLRSLAADDIRILDLETVHHQADVPISGLSCVLYPREHAPVAKQVWQHTGDGVSSRRGEFCLQALREGLLVEKDKHESSPKTRRPAKGPRRYQRADSIDGVNPDAKPATNGHTAQTTNGVHERKESSQFIEERFGRNLNAAMAMDAKRAIRRRILGSLTADVDLDQALGSHSEVETSRVSNLTEDDVYIYPTGMSSIFNTHRTMMAIRGPMRSICYGFPYTDTLKILEKWGPGCLFYGNGTETELDDLESRCSNGERFLALFCEFPSNPLLRTPNLLRIQALAAKYDFAVVVDESVGNLINVNVLPHADVVVSSLTKVFSGDSNVMGGSAILNPNSRYYSSIKDFLSHDFQEENYWVEDAVFMERNSRDFVSRIGRLNTSAAAIATLLKSSPIVKEVYYPLFSDTRPNYEDCRTPDGGYGGLLSVTFHSTTDAVTFFDNLEVQKGPSLGTNFTLACPYTVLAHYAELDWARQFGVETDLVRISFGLENLEDLKGMVGRTLEAVEKAATS